MIKKPITKEEFIRVLGLNGGYFSSDADKNYKWRTSRERKQLLEYESMMRFYRLQKLNKPNNFIIEYLSSKVRENYFNKFNEIYWADSSLRDGYLFCKELMESEC